MSDVVDKYNIPAGEYCEGCRFLSDCEGCCCLYGYLKFYEYDKKIYVKHDVCKLDYPNGATLLLVKESGNE